MSIKAYKFNFILNLMSDLNKTALRLFFTVPGGMAVLCFYITPENSRCKATEMFKLIEQYLLKFSPYKSYNLAQITKK
jgi:hypothetical protein